MSISGDRIFLPIIVIKETLSPYWDENFSFIIDNYEKDIFLLSLKNKIKSDEEIGSINLQINNFQISKVYKKWVEIQKKEKNWIN